MTTTYLWKDSLNSDGQQSHQYQSVIFTHWAQKTMLEIQVLVWDRYKHVVGLKRSRDSNLPSW